MNKITKRGGGFGIPTTTEYDGSEVTRLVKVMNYNICRALRTEKTRFAFKNRVDRIYKIIEINSPDIMMLQECLRFTSYDEEDSIEGFFDNLRKMGYTIEEFRTNGTPLCLVNCICYKRDRFFLMERDIKFLSDTPDVPSPGWGNGFGRIVGRVKLYPLDVEGKIMTDYLFGVCVTHFSLPEEARDKEARIFHNLIYSDVPTVFSGDFNSFGDHAEAQRKLLFEIPGVEDACKYVKGTWLGWDEDFPVKVGEIREKLDGLAGKGGIYWHGDTIVLDGQFGKDTHLTGTNYDCPSDHAPIIAWFGLNKK